MRYLERSILLQMIDNRWREHLYDMDYLREGIHLRGFAQIDPLVAYKNEGFTMFEELMHSIWEEFSKLIFHVEVEVEPGAGRSRPSPATAQRQPAALDYSGGTPEASPRRCRQVGGAGAGRRRSTATAPAAAPTAATAPPEVVETVVKDEHDKIGRNDPCWCGSGKKYKKCHGGVAPRLSDARPRPPTFIRAFNERRPRTAFVAVLDPEVELHSMKGLRKGRRGGAAVGDRRAGRGAADDRARASSTRTRPSRDGPWRR